jgi:hypothetical protein
MSLCARVLKGKYFPNRTFIVATRKKKSSETWRAILHGRRALMKGLINRIGPGDSISIWSDKWIAGLGDLKPLIRYPGTQLEKVSDLFIPSTRLWNEQLVHDSFCAFEAEEILKLKPSARLEKDVLAWAFEKNDISSVRTCYRLLKHVTSRRRAKVMKLARLDIQNGGKRSGS